MNLTRILVEFNKTKEQIRNRTRFGASVNEKYDGLTMAVAYSNVIEYIVKELFDLTAEERDSKGIAAFLYGSPGRREMVCESDLDIMLIYRNNSKEYKEFKDKFRKSAALFKFCKIDLPQWGSIDEAATFAKKSITEGNQVLESRFICGDEKIKQEVEKI